MKDSVVIDYESAPYRQRLRTLAHRLPSIGRSYIAGMFPIFQWIHRYNLSWLLQDIIAGVTVGIVIVPQSMAYAKIANLDPQYGLYTSFVGVSIYCFFGTSKDISIGPISTVSLLVGQAINIITSAHPDITGPDVAVTLALFAGIITIIIGMVRLGIVVDFIPGPAIAGYMTGSAITIGLSQWPKLFGLSSINTHNPPYLIFINFCKHLPQTRLDVAFGLVGLLALYAIKFGCGRLVHRVPTRLSKFVFYCGIMRNGFIVILGTLISFAITVGRQEKPISIIETVPAGFDAMQVPGLNIDIVSQAGSILPSIVLILILEHVSVAKSFGRIYDYNINPDQEILAIGLSNVIGSFFGAYPATGAFSRTAIMARSGVKTPIAGVFSGAVVVLALYALTPAFYYIPEAILAAVVIHAVSDLVSGPRYLKELWRTKPTELVVWVCTVLVTIFVDVETGIYVAVGLSLALLLFRVARPPVKVLARMPLDLDDDMRVKSCEDKSEIDSPRQDLHYYYVDERDPNFATCAEALPPGILVLRPGDSILYPNAGHMAEAITETIKARTRCGNQTDLNRKDADRPWNHPPMHGDSMKRQTQPTLKALVLDFGAVQQLDSTALQTLINLQSSISRYAGQPVEWHFANIQNQQVRRDLLDFGFGRLDRNAGQASGKESGHDEEKANHTNDHISASVERDLEVGSTTHQEDAVLDMTDPHTCLPRDRWVCFHWDVDSAVRSIVERWKNPFPGLSPAVSDLSIDQE